VVRATIATLVCAGCLAKPSLPPQGPRCITWSGFLAAKLEAPSTSASDQGPFLTDDGLTLYYSSDETGDREIYVAERATTADTFPHGAKIANIDTPAGEDDPFVTANGELWFARDNAIYLTHLSSPTQAVDAGLKQIDGATSPALTADRKTIYFDSQRNGDPSTDLYVATRATAADAFGDARKLALSDPVAEDSAPSVGDHESTLVFARHGTDELVFTAAREGVDSFGPAAELAGLHANNLDFDPSLSADGATLVFASSRGNTGTDADLWIATRSCVDPP
jgi:Tol biopolymer transport system component